MDRKEAIENLKGLQKLVAFNQQNFDALEIAINSLEVDEAYQLEYEKVDTPEINVGSMGEQMEFPTTFEEFAKNYGFRDKQEIYTNGSELIPVFRVEQWIEHIKRSTCDIEKSTFRKEQYKADTDTAYQCGFMAGQKRS